MAETIAIIDDTEGTRYALRRTLERAGFQVLEGENGADALRLAALRPALVILDVHLPDIMGPDVARQIKSEPTLRGIPVLHLSASHTSETDRATGLNSGADAYLTEPVEPELLLATIHALLRSRAAERVAERAVRQRDDLMLVTAHDVRGILQAVRLGLEAQLLRAQEQDIDRPALARAMQRSVRELGSMTRLLQDMLDGAQVEARKLVLHLEPGDLLAIVAASMERERPDAVAAGCTLTLDAKGEVPGRFDAVRVAQVVENLLSNAIKYGAGKPITVAVRSGEGEAEISITDQGRGIAKSEQERVFERFERAEEQARAGSYGLGLWIAREVAKLQGGTVELRSEIGKGSTFTFRLPLG